MGDAGQNCLHEMRYRPRRKLTQDAPNVAQDLGLTYVGKTDRETLRAATLSLDFEQRLSRAFRNLYRSHLVVEATDENDAHYIIVETPFRVFIADAD